MVNFSVFTPEYGPVLVSEVSPKSHWKVTPSGLFSTIVNVAVPPGPTPTDAGGVTIVTPAEKN